MMMMRDDDDYGDIDGEVSLPYPTFNIKHANIYMYQIAYLQSPRSRHFINQSISLQQVMSLQDDDDDYDDDDEIYTFIE